MPAPLGLLVNVTTDGAPLRRHIESSLREASTALAALLADQEALGNIERAAAVLIEVLSRKGRIYSGGNGGSLCDAMHFAEELTGRYRRDRVALAATAISDAGHLTCVGNDLGYDHVFSRYLEAHGRAGDCLVALSTSGTSENIIAAAKAAKAQGIHVVVLSGRRSEPLASLSTVYIYTPGGAFADRCKNCTSRSCIFLSS